MIINSNGSQYGALGAITGWGQVFRTKKTKVGVGTETKFCSGVPGKAHLVPSYYIKALPRIPVALTIASALWASFQCSPPSLRAKISSYAYVY